MTKREAIEILKDGGSWGVYEGIDRFGKKALTWNLFDANGKRVSGFGRIAFRDCMDVLVGYNFSKAVDELEMGTYYLRSYLWNVRKEKTRDQWCKVAILAKHFDINNQDDRHLIIEARDKARKMWVGRV